MTTRRFFLAAMTGALLPLPARSQAPWGVVRELSGEVTLNDFPVTRASALRAGQSLRTGADGRIWFMLGGDAYFLRPNSTLRLDTSRPSEPVVDFLRLVTGALGSTFARGMRRSLVTPTATIGIRGTGVYLECTRDVTYACTCFGTTEISSTPTGSMMETVAVSTQNHQARMIHRESMMGTRIVQA
ncbi:MAG TPA: hypothetical protein VIV54_14255, partial [Burkholderiales bacterium]